MGGLIEVRALSTSDQASAVHIKNKQDAAAATALLNDVINALIKTFSTGTPAERSQYLPPGDGGTVSGIEVRALSFCDQARAIRIQGDRDATAATALLNDVINPLIKEGDELFDAVINAAYRLHRVLIAIKERAVGGLGPAKLHIRNELGRWAQEVQDREREARLRIEQEARDKEAQRIQREVEAIRAAGEEDAAEQIQAILDAPRPALVLPPEAFTSSVAVPGAYDVYEVKVTNLREFYRAIGDGRTPVTMAEPKQSALNARARADGEYFNLPGCQVHKSKKFRSSRSTR